MLYGYRIMISRCWCTHHVPGVQCSASVVGLPHHRGPSHCVMTLNKKYMSKAVMDVPASSAELRA
jgi:hypothetical protein